MKKIIESLFALGMLFATVGCDQDQIVAKFDTSGEDAGTAYFVKNAVSENFEASATGTQTINLDLFRQDAAGELTVGLTAEMDEAAAKFFRIPESVTFADGDYRVIVPVSVLDVEKFDKGVTYAVSISVNNAGTENESSASIGSKYASVTLSASLTLNWVPCYVLKDFSKLLSTDLTDADYVVGPDGKPMLQGGVIYLHVLVGRRGRYRHARTGRGNQRVPPHELGRRREHPLYDQRRQDDFAHVAVCRRGLFRRNQGARFGSSFYRRRNGRLYVGRR